MCNAKGVQTEEKQSPLPILLDRMLKYEKVVTGKNQLPDRENTLSHF